MPEILTIGRLAPSPTGGLHLGHARTFLIAWLSARHAGGKVVLRIEDLDASRVRDEAAATALIDLKWLGLDWDGEPVVQTHRRSLYDQALQLLKARKLVYPCTCTRADIARSASAPHAEDEGPTYPGTCSHRQVGDANTLALAGRPFAWRFRVASKVIDWHDLFRGPQEGQPARLGGDFIIGRHGLGPSYQLAVVVDDAQMGVTQVIRGDDLVPSTPRQLLLYQALGHEPPTFGHVPLAIAPDGRRLAKRDGSIKLATLRTQGVDPKRLVGLLVRSCGWSEKLISSWPGDWIGHFDPRSLPAKPWVVTRGSWTKPSLEPPRAGM